MEISATWIWVPGHRRTRNFYGYARKRFELPEGAASGKVWVTAGTEYQLFLNGHYLGRGPNPCDPRWQYVDEYDLTHALRPGANVLAALLHNEGIGTHSRLEQPGGFLLDAHIQAGQAHLQIQTDDTWRVLAAEAWNFGAPQQFWTIGFQEHFDATREPHGWKSPEFDDSQWLRPELIGKPSVEPWIRLIPREIPPLRERSVCPASVYRFGEALPGSPEDPSNVALRIAAERKFLLQTAKIENEEAVLRPGGDSARVEAGPDRYPYLVVDFGTEVVGYPRIQLSGAGGVLDMGYSEALSAEGDVDPVRQNVYQADSLSWAGGNYTWEIFSRRAFRYLQLSFRELKGPVEIQSIHIQQVGYPVEKIGAFECSDPLLNRIWQVGVDTLQIAMQDHYEDCPLREHGQYPGDSLVEFLFNAYSFGDAKLARKGLRQFTQTQGEDGFFRALYPADTDHRLPDYNAVWVIYLWEYYRHTGDRALLEELWPNLVGVMRWLKSHTNSHGLIIGADNPENRWWVFIDHAPLDKRGEGAAFNAFYCQALKAASGIAGALGRSEAQAGYETEAAQLTQAFRERLWDESRGVYADCRVGESLSETISEQSNTLAILFGLADEAQTQRILQYLDSDQPHIKSAGPYFNFYVLSMLDMVGRHDAALALIRRHWGNMLARGATVWWETFDESWPGDFIYGESLCHAWSGAPTWFLPACILGVRPEAPGFARFVFAPQPGDLEFSRGVIPTPYGPIEAKWKQTEQGITASIRTPEGVSGRLLLGGDEIRIPPGTSLSITSP